jgi:hypothetical protein
LKLGPFPETPGTYSGRNYWVVVRRASDVTTVVIYGKVGEGFMRDFFAKDVTQMAKTLGASSPPKITAERAIISVRAQRVLCTPRSLARALSANTQLSLRPIETKGGTQYLSSAALTRMLVDVDLQTGLCDMQFLTKRPDEAIELVRQVQDQAADDTIVAPVTKEAAVWEEIEAETSRRLSEAYEAATAHGGVPYIDVESLRAAVAADPHFQQSLAGAPNRYVIRFRATDDYEKLTIRWYWLVDYAPPLTYSSRRLISSSVYNNISRRPADELASVEMPLTLEAGQAYQLDLVGRVLGGGSPSVDQRIYLFDGETFHEQ